MSFFDTLIQGRPVPLRLDREHRVTAIRNMVPGIALMESLTARGEACAVTFGPFEVYHLGFFVHVHCRQRPEPVSADADQAQPYPWRRAKAQSVTAADEPGLLWGLEYPDGRRGATNQLARAVTPSPDSEGDQDADLICFQRTGPTWPEMNGQRERMPFWVYPLPPAGLCRLHVSWLPAGLAETAIEFDGAVIRAAAERSVTLWPETP